MNSKAIASELEGLWPEPSLHLDSPYQGRIESLFNDVMVTLPPTLVPQVPRAFVNPRSRDYWIPDREKSWGMSLDEYAKGGEKGFEDAKHLIKRLGDMYKADTNGPFLEGTRPIYADLANVLG